MVQPFTVSEQSGVPVGLGTRSGHVLEFPSIEQTVSDTQKYQNIGNEVLGSEKRGYGQRVVTEPGARVSGVTLGRSLLQLRESLGLGDFSLRPLAAAS
jgi:hypothetical protein